MARPSFRQYERRFMEALADRLPGVRGYREAEAAVQTDHRFRAYVADQLDRHRDRLGSFRHFLLRSGRFDLLDDVEYLAQQMTRLADRVRTADYIYADFFRRGPLTYEQVARLYQTDTEIVQTLQVLERWMEAATPPTDPGAYLREVTEAVLRLQTLFERRTEMTGRPWEGG